MRISVISVMVLSVALLLTGCATQYTPYTAPPSKPQPLQPTQPVQPAPPVQPVQPTNPTGPTQPDTAGYVSPIDTMFLLDRFAAGCDIPVGHAYGIGDVAGAVALLRDGYVPVPMHRIVLALGDFDILNGVSDATLQAQYTELLTLARAQNVQVIIASMPDMYEASGQDYYQSHVDALNALINAQLGQTSVYVWNLSKPLSDPSLFDATKGNQALSVQGCSTMTNSYATINQ